jgi:hypothetical protein
VTALPSTTNSRTGTVTPSPVTTTDTQITSNSDGQISTVVRVSVVIADSASSTNTPLESNDNHHLSQPAIIGVLIGAPLGLIALALLLWIARWDRRNKTDTTSTVYFPPDPIDPSATRVFPRAELEALPAVTADVQREPFELEGSTVMPMGPGSRASQMGELEDTPKLSNRISALTTANEGRWSAVSSLLPSSLPSPPATAADTARAVPVAMDLQIIGQQHYASTGQHGSTPQQHHESLYKSSSGRLPTMDENSSEPLSTPSPNIAEHLPKNSQEHDFPPRFLPSNSDRDMARCRVIVGGKQPKSSLWRLARMYEGCRWLGLWSLVSV